MGGQMNRRRFLTILGLAPLAAAVPKMPAEAAQKPAQPRNHPDLDIDTAPGVNALRQLGGRGGPYGYALADDTTFTTYTIHTNADPQKVIDAVQRYKRGSGRQ